MFRRFVAIAALMGAVLTLGACEEGPPPPDPAKSVPANPDDAMAWKKYISATVKDYVTPEESKRIYVTFSENGEDPELTARKIENMKNFIGRGIAEGTPLIFASPDSKLMADIVEQAFAEPKEDTLKTIRVIFIGARSEEERVRTAVTPWGVKFTFHEAK